MCTSLLHPPRKSGGPAEMCWQRQELTQVARGREQVGLFSEVTPSFLSLLIPARRRGAGSRAPVHLCPAPLRVQLGDHGGHASIPYPVSLYTFIHRQSRTRALGGASEQRPAFRKSKITHAWRCLTARRSRGRTGMRICVGLVCPFSTPFVHPLLQ